MEKITLKFNEDTYVFEPKVVEGQPSYTIYVNGEVEPLWHLQMSETGCGLYEGDILQGTYLDDLWYNSSNNLSYEVVAELVRVIRM